MREYKTLAFKAGDTADLQDDEFKGYLSTWDADLGGDIIQQGAFAGTLPDFLDHGTVCWQHDWTTPIGKWLAAHEDTKGLFVKGKISQTTAGKDALILMRDDVIKRMSIGYDVLAYKVLSDEEGTALLGEAGYGAALRDVPWYMDGLRVLTEIKLYEGSPVTVPMNPKAVITGVKDISLLAGLNHDAHFETVLAAVAEWTNRVKAIGDLRQKAGRMLSAANAGKLQNMRDSLATHMQTLDDLISANTPMDDPDADQEAIEVVGKSAAALGQIRLEYLRWQQHQAHLNGAA